MSLRPNGITGLGYGERDIPALIEGTLKQLRLLSGAPRAVGTAELDLILRDSLCHWLLGRLASASGR